MNTKVKTLKTEVRDVLENNILDFWLHHMVDEENMIQFLPAYNYIFAPVFFLYTLDSPP